MVCALLLAPLVVVAAPAPYGEYFIRLGDPGPQGATSGLGSAPAATPANRDSAAYERQLSLLEEAGGPYADTLAEPLADLARLHRGNGDIEQAQHAFERALHLIRINDGLYSESQIPVLKELFGIFRMTGDLASLDARYGYYFRLYGSGQAPYTALRVGAALEYLGWQREALSLGIDEKDTDRLLALYSLNQRLLDGVASDPSAAFASYRALVLSQLRNLYQIQSKYEARIEVQSTNTYPGAPAPWDNEDANQQRLESLQRNALTRGRKLLQELISRTPPEQVEELAGAYLELADWNQWNDRRREASLAYAEVVSILQNAGQSALLLEWLGRSVELPANGAFWRSRQLGGTVEPIIVQARFDVTAAGRAKNIEATAAASEYEGKAGKVRRDLRDIRFRPRIVNGEPEAETNQLRDYEVLN